MSYLCIHSISNLRVYLYGKRQACVFLVPCSQIWSAARANHACMVVPLFCPGILADRKNNQPPARMPRRRPVGPSCREGLLCAAPPENVGSFTMRSRNATLPPQGNGGLQRLLPLLREKGLDEGLVAPCARLPKHGLDHPPRLGAANRHSHRKKFRRIFRPMTRPVRGEFPRHIT